MNVTRVHELLEREREYAGSMAAGPGAGEGEPELLVSDREAGAIRWAGFDEAVADAQASLDIGLASARETLGQVLAGAYLAYQRSVAGALARFEASRRAAEETRELAAAQVRP